MCSKQDNPLADEQQVQATLYHYAEQDVPSNLDLTAAIHRRLWHERMDRLEELLHDIQANQQITQQAKEQEDVEA